MIRWAVISTTAREYVTVRSLHEASLLTAILVSPTLAGNARVRDFAERHDEILARWAGGEIRLCHEKSPPMLNLPMDWSDCWDALPPFTRVKPPSLFRFCEECYTCVNHLVRR